MKQLLVPILLLLFGPLLAQEPGRNCLTGEEQALGRLINEYRMEKHLPGIKLSASLCFVARTHSKDLSGTDVYKGKCNLHSWSDQGKWTACCYTPDHKDAACMWNKPRELTTYQGDGFEIAYFTTATFDTPEMLAREALKAWKGSPGHNEIIINSGKWADMDWKAMGVGSWNGYVTVWFGKETDPAGEPEICK
ncbi:MAG: CAP domain-containing protein [Bacteroidetes bacterium]|nr:CAP domain-containing protein [Bacteroidota bacterium]